MVLSTAPGERLMRPQFGCSIWDLLFEPVNSNTLGLMMAQAVREAVAQWEPREVEVVECAPDARRRITVVHIEVTYRVRATNNRRNLVYPFYVIPRGSLRSCHCRPPISTTASSRTSSTRPSA